MNKRDVNYFSFAHLTLTLLLHYLVKCRSRTLAVYNSKCMRRLRTLLRDHKIIENLLYLS